MSLKNLDREHRNIDRRIKQDRFPQVKGLDTFYFQTIPGLNKALVLELERCEWIARKESCNTRVLVKRIPHLPWVWLLVRRIIPYCLPQP